MNPATSNPGTSKLVIQRTKAEITQEKSPKVIIVTGSERISKNGRRNVFNKPRTIAAINASMKFCTIIPGTRYAVPKRASALATIEKTRFMVN